MLKMVVSAEISSSLGTAALLPRGGGDFVEKRPITRAMALALHRYPRGTEDFDLGIGIAPQRLGDVKSAL